VLALSLFLGGIAAAWLFWLQPMYAGRTAAAGEDIDLTESMEEIAESSPDIDYNEESGALYTNCAVLVVVANGTDIEDVRDLAEEYDAELDSELKSFGFYTFRFEEAREYKKLTRIVEDLQDEAIVESASLDYLFLADEKTVEARDAAFPDDPWTAEDEAEAWDVSLPDGNNWGMEAIHAPGAWGYADEMSPVKVGLIDGTPDQNHPDLIITNSSVFLQNDTTITQNTSYTDTGDNSRHGTHVAGTMAAGWDNGMGVSGVICGESEIYHARYYTHVGSSYKYLVSASTYLYMVEHLVNQGVRVINISEGYTDELVFAASRGNAQARNILEQNANVLGAALRNLITQREADGKESFLVVVAAGNANNDNFHADANASYGYRKATGWECFWGDYESGNVDAAYGSMWAAVTDEVAKSHIVIVGSAGHDVKGWLNKTVEYTYSAFSLVGSRVDIVAPGERIYSSVNGSYAKMDGTSMASPHVAGVAGLIYACNPDLSGADVKNILLATAGDAEFEVGGTHRVKMVNAEQAVISAIRSRDEDVEEVVDDPSVTVAPPLDLCFVVDTTGSMGDDIDNAKENMEEILESLREKTANYRVALIDYRDFADRTGESEDYPCRVQLNFSDNDIIIRDAIDALTLGNGGDNNETVYSALMEATTLNWREFSTKVIIVLGDAAPLDPEPYTGYTYETVLQALVQARIALDGTESDEEALGALATDTISVFSVGIGTNADANAFFENIALETGGSFSSVEDAEGVADAVVESIEQIEIVTSKTVTMNFGKEHAGTRISIYQDGEYRFSFALNDVGQATVPDMAFGSYTWECEELSRQGSFEIEKDTTSLKPEGRDMHWFAPIQRLWLHSKLEIILCAAGAVVLLTAIPVVLSCSMTAYRKKKK
ncbi:MAG: S8 family serine peptidase, partial [Oscillospiraceae bacterium]|nr:S8 family serine peptidase [Oscillospiraceae bacterium]